MTELLRSEYLLKRENILLVGEQRDGEDTYRHCVGDRCVFAREEGAVLGVHFVLGQTDTGVIAFVVLGTAVVDVIPISALGLFRLRLAGDGTTAMGTLDQIAGAGHLVLFVDLLDEEVLAPIPKTRFR